MEALEREAELVPEWVVAPVGEWEQAPAEGMVSVQAWRQAPAEVLGRELKRGSGPAQAPELEWEQESAQESA